MTKLLSLALWLWLSSAALAAPPPLPDLTSEEVATLGQGQVVIRPPSSPTDEVLGVVDIPATTEQVWKVILDFDARVQTVKVLKAIEVYAQESDPGGLGASFHMAVLGSKVTYHLRYHIDRVAGYCSFRLDPEREQDIAAANGSYRMVELPEGGVRVFYRSATDPGRYVPGFIQKMLAQDALRNQLEQMAQLAVKK